MHNVHYVLLYILARHFSQLQILNHPVSKKTASSKYIPESLVLFRAPYVLQTATDCKWVKCFV